MPAADARTQPPALAGTELHIAGPLEDEYDSHGTLWRVQRCLHCDARLLGVIYQPDKTVKAHTLGQHIRLADPCTRRAHP